MSALPGTRPRRRRRRSRRRLGFTASASRCGGKGALGRRPVRWGGRRLGGALPGFLHWHSPGLVRWQRGRWAAAQSGGAGDGLAALCRVFYIGILPAWCGGKVALGRCPVRWGGRRLGGALPDFLHWHSPGLVRWQRGAGPPSSQVGRAAAWRRFAGFSTLAFSLAYCSVGIRYRVGCWLPVPPEFEVGCQPPRPGGFTRSLAQYG